MSNNNHASTENSLQSTKVCIQHFNDVYVPQAHQCDDTDRQERLGRWVPGAAYFATQLDQSETRLKATYGVSKVCRVFSGDLLGPSLLSSVTQGVHMMEILELLKVDVATPGNHEFDYGIEYWSSLLTEKKLFHATSGPKVPWIVANLVEANNPSKIICNMLPTHISTYDGIKIGFIGIAEDWRTECGLSEKEVSFLEMNKVAKMYAQKLKTEDKVDFVVAVTHARQKLDLELAKQIPEIDLVLGGHDHRYFEQISNRVVKSGADFEDFTEVILTFDKDKKIQKMEAKRVETCFATKPEEKLPEDPAIAELLTNYDQWFEEQKKVVLGKTQVDLDATKDALRLGESSFGNWICDVFRDATGSEICIISGGIISSDKVWRKENPITFEHLAAWFPWGGSCPVVRVTGEAVIQALENGFHLIPRREGRFPQVSGIRVKWNPKNEPMNRVVEVTFQGKPIEKDRLYTVTVTEFLILGNDGYVSLMGTPENTVIPVEASQSKVGIIKAFLSKNQTIHPTIDNRLEKIQ